MNKSRSVGVQKKEPLTVTMASPKCTVDLWRCTAGIPNVCVSLRLHQVNILILGVLWAANRITGDFHLYKGQFKGPICNIYTDIYWYKME